MKLFCLFGFLFAGVCLTAGDSPFDARRLQTGHFAYRIMQDGKQIATFTLTITVRPDGTYVFTGDAQGFHQHWESVAQAGFSPVSGLLNIIRDDGRHYDMTVRYADGRAHGTVTREPAAARESDRPLPANTIDQRIDWAAMLSSRLAVGDELAFHVYDPDTGATPVAARAEGLKSITVPAGTFEALRLSYRMAKADGPETYEVQVTPGTPRIMLREEFPDGSITELVKATPLPQTE
jgi:hypothetical protein